MRSDKEILQLIIDKAASDERIRAVLLNGSRVNPTVSPDAFQDFDIVFIVAKMDSFLADHGWTEYFGEKSMEQLPATMKLYNDAETEQGTGFTYLMLFTDGNRIDLTLYPLENIQDYKPESLTRVLLDKDEVFKKISPANENDYLIKRPSGKEFTDVCNEFWWVSTYVAKGLARNEITYAKECMETIVRPMFMKMIAWWIGNKTDFLVNIGKGGRFMRKFISEEMYDEVLATYAGNNIEDNWKALFKMTELFAQIAKDVAANLNFFYRPDEEHNVIAYVHGLKQKRK